MKIQILMANTLAGLENKIGHALDEGWNLAGHINHYTYKELVKENKSIRYEDRVMFYILVMKA